MATSDYLLQEILSQVAEPMILIDLKRRAIFATESFKSLSGMQEVSEKKCVDLFVPSFSSDRRALCCWDVFEFYSRHGESGIWLLRTSDGTYRSVLCRMCAIDVAQARAMIALCVKPVTAAAPNTSILFFRSVLSKIGEQEAFKQWACGYLKKAWGLKSLMWLEPRTVTSNLAGTPTLSRSAALGALIDSVITQTQCAGPFDITVQRDNRTDVFHAFPACEGASPSVLLVKSGKKPLDEQLVSEAMAVVLVANEMPAAIESDESATNSTVLSGLTNREREVLALLAQGLTHQQIGSRLYISVYTVKNHIRSMMHKCHVSKSINLATLYASAK